MAGFATQLWWGAIRILVFAAFYSVNAAAAPISLADVVTYVWLGQALLALQPWIADPEIGQAVRTGGVGYDRLRPLDAYGYWYARTVGWMLARALPRAVLMVLAAAIVLPLVGLGDWAWRPPSGVAAALLFVPAFVLMTMLARRRSDAGEHHRRGEPQRARGECRPGAAGDRVLGQPAAARLLSRRAGGPSCMCSRSPDWSTSRSASTSPISRAPRRCSGLALQAGWTLVLIGLGRLRHGAHDAPAGNAGGLIHECPRPLWPLHRHLARAPRRSIRRRP